MIRTAGTTDRQRLERLSQLDGKTIAAASYVLAEIKGELVAAAPIGGGEALADPFRPTAEIVSLLALRARQLAAVPAAA